MAKGKLFVGTSGWSYGHWGKGVFYPRGLKPGRWLEFFAEHFGTVELNATFYRLPKESVVAGWRRRTPAGFVFAVKASRRITHELKLGDAAEALATFLQRIEPLGPRRGPLLFQLPPSFRYDHQRLRGFLKDLGAELGRRRRRVVFEFRHPSWINPAVEKLLTEEGMAICEADGPSYCGDRPNAVDFVYVRRHGPGADHRTSYNDQELGGDAERIRRWLARGRDVYTYFNNDVAGHAVANARRLRELVER